MKNNKVVYDSLSDRDKKTIELIDKIGPLTREQIQRVLFKGVHHNVPNRRLTVLTENKLIKRSYYQIASHKNVYVYYTDNKPAKRNIIHEITVSEFITNVMSMCEVIAAETHYVIGDMEYKGSDGRLKRIFLEVQRSGKTSDCIDKYKNIKKIILDERREWHSIPRLIVITDLEHNNEQLKNMKIKYDTTEMKNLREILF